MKRLPIIIAALLLAATHADAAITSAAVSRQGAITQLSFALDHPAPRFHLSAHGNELWIDLDRTGLQIPSRPFYGREGAPIGVVRAFSPSGLHARIVVEVIDKSDYAIVQRQREIVVRFAPAGQVANLRRPLMPDHLATAPMPRPVAIPRTVARAEPVSIRPPLPEPSSAIANPLVGNPLVMIDPGHGGYDPGTQSGSGILEKDVALSIARQVADALKARGVRAQMTRESDDFISLPERTRRANL